MTLQNNSSDGTIPNKTIAELHRETPLTNATQLPIRLNPLDNTCPPTMEELAIDRHRWRLEASQYKNLLDLLIPYCGGYVTQENPEYHKIPEAIHATMRQLKKYQPIVPNSQVGLTAEADMVQLHITAHSIEGQIQISYLREADGLEHNFIESGDRAFTISVNLPEEYLSPRIPTVVGTV